jgi:hypothetical protein
MNTVSAELHLDLIGPEHTIVPLIAGLHYTSADPYAIRMAFHVGTAEPVEWTLARDLLAAALVSPQGAGDVRAWPSSAPQREEAPDGTAAGLLHLAMRSPFGQAQFQAPASAVASFLDRTYALVPDGGESAFIDIDSELAELLSGF